MTGEWEEKKGQKQTDRWSGKVMQLKGWNSTLPALNTFMCLKKKKT